MPRCVVDESHAWYCMDDVPGDAGDVVPDCDTIGVDCESAVECFLDAPVTAQTPELPCDHWYKITLEAGAYCITRTNDSGIATGPIIQVYYSETDCDGLGSASYVLLQTTAVESQSFTISTPGEYYIWVHGTTGVTDDYTFVVTPGAC